MFPAAETENQNLRRQAAWVVGCRVVGIVATFGSSILAARLLGPAEFGTFLLLTTVAAFGSLLGMAGLNEASLRFISESLGLHEAGRARAYLRRTAMVVAVTSLLAAVTMAIALAALQWASGKTIASASLVTLVAVGIVVLACQQLAAEMLRAYGNLPVASFFSGGQSGGPVCNVLFLAALVIATAVGARLDATVALSLTVGCVCVTCPLVILSLWRTSRGCTPILNDKSLSRDEQRELLAVGGVLLLNQFLGLATQQFDMLLAGGLLTSTDLGLYGAAKRSLLTAAIPVQMAALTIVASVPRLHAQSRTLELQRLVRGAATAAAIPALAALVLLVLFSRPILSFVLRDAYGDASGMVMILALGYLGLVLSGNPQYVLTMTGRHRAVLSVNMLSALVLVVAGYFAGRLFGAYGLAAAAATSLLVQNGLLWWIARRDLGIWTHVTLPLAKAPSRPPADSLPLSPAARSHSTDNVYPPESLPSSIV